MFKLYVCKELDNIISKSNDYFITLLTAAEETIINLPHVTAPPPLSFKL